MKFISSLAGAALAFAFLPACKQRGEAERSDLSEAGYQLTAADWFRASRENDASALKKFTAAGFSVSTLDEAGDSGLHVAAAAGARDSADFLLNRGLSVDLRGASDRTPVMAAVIGQQTQMVRWLLRQGADPSLKDQDGFKPLMLAVREGSKGAVAELAPYNRGDLDPALLLAALVGRAEVIDELTNYGASIYACMDDGRTPLMIAAENGHAEAVKLLLDIGSSRYTVSSDGRTAADFAENFPEIAALIAREPVPAELSLETPEEIADTMAAFVDAAAGDENSSTSDGPGSAAIREAHRHPVSSIAGATLSSPVAPAAAAPSAEVFPMPPLAMRHYREKEVPISVKSVKGETATLALAGVTPREVQVRPGETVPGSRLVVVRVRRRMEDSKVNPGSSSEISVVEVRDANTGASREWIAGVPSKAHDPVALVEDEATGKRYLASPGQRFTGADGAEYLISDVRPNQMVIQEVSTGEVRTIPLRGPRG
jgi:ankyrin repeat protein